MIATTHIGFIKTETFTDAEKEQLELSYLTDHQDRAHAKMPKIVQFSDLNINLLNSIFSNLINTLSIWCIMEQFELWVNSLFKGTGSYPTISTIVVAIHSILREVKLFLPKMYKINRIKTQNRCWLIITKIAHWASKLVIFFATERLLVWISDTMCFELSRSAKVILNCCVVSSKMGLPCFTSRKFFVQHWYDFDACHRSKL